MIVRTLLLFALVGAWSGPARAAPLAGYELVHNAPLYTSLTTPDLREPVKVWCDMLDRARRSADFEQFYVAGKTGGPLDQVIRCMERAARKGVKIRFLMEAAGLAMSDEATLSRLRAIPGLELRTLKFADLTGSGIIHAKFFVIDGVSAYIGSQNFDWRALEHIDETGLKIDDPHAVNQLAAIFAQDWAAQQVLAAGGKVAPSTPTEQPDDGQAAATLVASPKAFNPPGVADSEAMLVKLLGQAQKEVRIVVMTYAPLDRQRQYYGAIDSAIRAAAARGVAIKLIVADWNLNETKTPWLQSLGVLPHVEIRVVTIPPAPGEPIPYARVVHTKVMAIDRKIGWVGTSNWEGGYLDNSRNVEVVLRDEAMAERIGELHESLWTSSYAKSLGAAIAARQLTSQPR